MWLGRLGVLGLVALAPPDLPRLDEIRIDGVVLGFSLVIALAASVLFGLAPALQVSRVQLVDGLRQGGKGSSIGSRGGWARSAFVVSEVALAVVLVFGAGLLGRSLVELASVQMGFVPERLLVLRTAVPVRSFQDASRATAFYRDLLGDLRALHGGRTHGHVGVPVADHAGHRRRQRQRIYMPYEQHPGPATLGLRIARGTRGADVGDDADNRHVFEGVEPAADAPANRILIGKRRPHERLVHDRDKRCIAAVAVVPRSRCAPRCRARRRGSGHSCSSSLPRWRCCLRLPAFTA